MKGFIKEIVLTEDDRKVLRKLYVSDDFQKLKGIVETHLQSLAYDLISRSENEEGENKEILQDIRGGFNLWREIINLMEIK